MAVKNFTLQELTKRIMINLPSRFTREEGSNVYKFFETIAEAFSIDTNKIDELITQTNLDTASGDYLDEYISGLAGFGRLNFRFQDGLSTEDEFEIISEDGDNLYLPTFSSGEIETDQEYKDRYTDVIYRYNCSKEGIRQIVIDFAYMYPSDMYVGSRRGAFASSELKHAKNFFSDSFNSIYGNGEPTSFRGYIEFLEKPPAEIIQVLCDHIEAAKAYGVKIYLKYPL